MFQATRICGVDKGKQRLKQTYHNPSRVKGLKRNDAAKFRAINPGDFRLQARTVYSLGRKYEISAPVHWPSKRRSHWRLRTAMREYRCGGAGAADSKPRPKWPALRPGYLDLGTWGLSRKPVCRTGDWLIRAVPLAARPIQVS